MIESLKGHTKLTTIEGRASEGKAKKGCSEGSSSRMSGLEHKSTAVARRLQTADQGALRESERRRNRSVREVDDCC